MKERETANVVQRQTDIRSDSCRQSRQTITTVMQREIRAKPQQRSEGPGNEKEYI